MALTVLDPGDESSPAHRQPRPRPATLHGLRVGLLDIAKPRGDVFLNRLAELFAQRGITTARYTKPTFTKPAPIDLRRRISAECDMLIEALAD
jgi:hypothetical protein